MKALCDLEPNAGTFIDMTCSFDHEEIGSTSHQGADSVFLAKVTERIFQVLSPKDLAKDAFQVAMKCSFVISADMAHAVHPNYAHKHQP